jgi:hypothetical protein
VKHLLILISFLLLSTFLTSCEKNGHGTKTFEDGSTYVGEFKDGNFDGQGTFTYGKGKYKDHKYVGDWKDGKYHGQGTFTGSDGDEYVGEFKDGEFDGQGTGTFSDGTKYEGEWKGGVPNGQGTGTFSDGTKYIGEWKDVKLWNGTEYNNNGEITVRIVTGKEIKQYPPPLKPTNKL